jgi:hypothetical protein
MLIGDDRPDNCICDCISLGHPFCSDKCKEQCYFDCCVCEEQKYAAYDWMEWYCHYATYTKVCPSCREYIE